MFVGCPWRECKCQVITVAVAAVLSFALTVEAVHENTQTVAANVQDTQWKPERKRELPTQISRHLNGAYKLVPTGTCTAAGGELISSPNDCNTAIGEVLGSTRTVTPRSLGTQYPPGCSSLGGTGNTVFFNTLSSSPAQCSSSRQCLCRMTQSNDAGGGGGDGAASSEDSSDIGATYSAITSGTCSEAGGDRIGTAKDCESAIQAVLRTTKTVTPVSMGSSSPPGCGTRAAGSQVFLNTFVGSPVPCTSSQQCLCKFSAGSEGGSGGSAGGTTFSSTV